jgi:hypothetical protein
MNFTQLLQSIGAKKTVQAQVIEATSGTHGDSAAYVKKMYSRVVQLANNVSKLTPQEKREALKAFTGIQFSIFNVGNDNQRLAASLGDRITAETQNRMGKLAGYISSNQTPIIAILLMVAAYAVIRFALTRRRIARATSNGQLQVALRGNRTGVNNIEVIHRGNRFNSRTSNAVPNANNNARSIAKSNASNSSNSGSNNNARSILNSNGNECQRITGIFKQASERTFPSTYALVYGVWRAMDKIVSETSLYEQVALPVAEKSLALTMNYSNESKDGDAYVNHLIEMFKECIETQKYLQKVIISGNQQTTRAINGSNSGNRSVATVSSRNCTREQVLEALRAILLYVKKLGYVLMYRALDVKSWHKPQTLSRLHASMDAFIDYSKNTNVSTLKGMVQRLFDTYGKIHKLYKSSDGRSHKYNQDILKGLPNEINTIMTMFTGMNWTKNKSKEARYRLGVARSRPEITWRHTPRGWERFMNHVYDNTTDTRPSMKMALVHKYMSSNHVLWQQFKEAWNSLKSNRPRVRGSNKLNNIELDQYSPQDASRIVQIQRLLFTPIRMMTTEGIIILLALVVAVLSVWAKGHHPILCGLVTLLCASLRLLSSNGHKKYKMEKQQYFKLLHTLVQDAETSNESTRIMTANNERDLKKAIDTVGSLASMQGRYIFWVSPTQQMPLIEQIQLSAERVHADTQARITGIRRYLGR